MELNIKMIVKHKGDGIKKFKKNQNDGIEVNFYPKHKVKQKVEKPKIDKQCPQCKQSNWIEFDRRKYCSICEQIIKKQKHKIDKKKYLDGIRNFLRDCQMLTKRLEKYIFLR